MSQAAVIGESARTAGFALAGALVFPAEDAGEARAAWSRLPADVAVLVLTPRAAAWLDLAPDLALDPALDPGLGPGPRARRDLLVAVMPP